MITIMVFNVLLLGLGVAYLKFFRKEDSKIEAAKVKEVQELKVEAILPKVGEFFLNQDRLLFITEVHSDHSVVTEAFTADCVLLLSNEKLLKFKQTTKLFDRANNPWELSSSYINGKFTPIAKNQIGDELHGIVELQRTFFPDSVDFSDVMEINFKK